MPSLARFLRGRTRVALVVAAMLASSSAVPAATAIAAQTAPIRTAAASATLAATGITIDGTQNGRTFDGIGAISGGGGNSRLLTDYPATQQSQILDYLFKPNYGANLQILKVEIGGDTNSTDGAEASIEHTKGTVNCDAGYEWWLMDQAKQRNPDIKFYGLAWGGPGWIGSDFWTQNSIDYLVSWLGCAKSHNFTVDYLGGWNEKGYNVSWFENLHSALATAGYGTVKVVGADEFGWGVADTMATDPKFAASIDIVGSHYPCGGAPNQTAMSCPATANAAATGKQLWASENGSQDYNTGAATLIRSIVRGYTDARLSAYINWPLIASAYPNLPFNTTGLMVADQPWSGSYSVGANLWATAQVTQFTKPGWSFIDSASGYLAGAESNGAYMTLKSTNGSDYSTVIDTTTAMAAQTANFTVTGGLSTGTAHVWSTNLASNDPSTYFVHGQDITPSGGTFSLTLQPGYVYTISTTSGQAKGPATSPAPAPLNLPYSDDFDSYSAGGRARLLADLNGSFEIRPCGGDRVGQCVRQMAAQSPIFSNGPVNPSTILGSSWWSDYTVASDVLLEQPGAVQLLGRVGTQKPFVSSSIDEYYLQVSDTGAWSIMKNAAGGGPTTLASGTTTAVGTGSWHHLALTFNGSSITAVIDGSTVGTVNDSSFAQGQVGYGINGYQTDEFDKLTVTPVAGSPGTSGPVTGYQGLCADARYGNSANGTPVQLYSCNGSNAQVWTEGANGALHALGKCLDVTGAATGNGTQVELWDCNGGPNQRWTPQADGSLLSVQSGRCLDDTAWGGSSTQLEIWDCNGGANQKWTLP